MSESPTEQLSQYAEEAQSYTQSIQGFFEDGKTVQGRLMANELRAHLATFLVLAESFAQKTGCKHRLSVEEDNGFMHVYYKIPLDDEEIADVEIE